MSVSGYFSAREFRVGKQEKISDLENDFCKHRLCKADILLQGKRTTGTLMNKITRLPIATSHK